MGDKPLSEPVQTWFTDANMRHQGGDELKFRARKTPKLRITGLFEGNLNLNKLQDYYSSNRLQATINCSVYGFLYCPSVLRPPVRSNLVFQATRDYLAVRSATESVCLRVAHSPLELWPSWYSVFLGPLLFKMWILNSILPITMDVITIHALHLTEARVWVTIS